MSATPEQIAAELGGMFMRLATETEDDAAVRRINTARAAAALIRAQAERVRVLEEALNFIAQWNIYDRPLIANEDNIRADDFPFYVAGRAHAELALISNYARNSVARAALKAAP